MTIHHVHHSTDQELTDRMLDAAARAERAEAAHDRARGKLADTTADRDLARRQRDTLQATLDQIRAFHDTWADVEDAESTLSMQGLWDELCQILHPVNETTPDAFRPEAS